MTVLNLHFFPAQIISCTDLYVSASISSNTKPPFSPYVVIEKGRAGKSRRKQAKEAVAETDLQDRQI